MWGCSVEAWYARKTVARVICISATSKNGDHNMCCVSASTDGSKKEMRKLGDCSHGKA